MNKLLYNALMLGRNKNVENEEFLVAEGNKRPAAFKVSEEKIDIEEVTDDTFFNANLEQIEEGFFEIEIYCSDEILKLEKKIITSEDFINGKFSLKIMVSAENVHNGKNFTQIIFKSSNQEISVPVTINNKIKIATGVDETRRIKMTLEENYIDFRMNRIGYQEWIIKDLRLLDDIPGADANALFLMLYKAQLHIMDENLEDAGHIIDFVSGQLPKLIEPDYDLSCYYIYVKSLYTMDNMHTEMALERVRSAYKRKPSWRILWMIFYMDSHYQDDLERKLIEIEDICSTGCKSPEMYFEAIEIFKARPNMIKNLSDFEMQVLNFAAKHDYINSAVVDRFADIILSRGEAELKHINAKLAIKILKEFYYKDPSSNVLRALCMLLVITDTRNQEDNEYFKKGIREAIKVPGLYNYYVYTTNKTRMDEFPVKLVEYFEDNADSLGQYRSYYFANIIANKYKHPDHYRAALNNIIAYTEYQLASGKVDEYMGVICKEILSNGLATSKIQQNLFSIICTKKIYCKNPRMISVLVFHNELNLYQDVFLEDGKAFVNIYSSSALILFKDVTGNIYYNVDFEKIDLLDTNEYIDMCIKGVPINRYMLLEDTLPILRAYKDPVDILQYLSNQLSTGLLRSEYEKKLMRESVMSFSKSRDMGIYDELLEFKKFNLDEETRGRLIEITIERKLYKQAFEEIKQYGDEYVSDEYIAKLAHVIVDLSDYNEEDELLLELCERTFRTTSFDPDIFDYLAVHSADDVELLIDLYRAASAYERNPDRIAERIIRRAVEKRENPDGTFHVFSKYYEKGNDEKLKDEYLTFRAIDYLVNYNKANKEFFKFLESGFVQKKKYDDRVYAAYLYYIADIKTPSTNQIKVADGILKDLTRRGIMLEKFKELRKHFDLPATLANSVIASKFADGAVKIPVISFYFNGNTSSTEEKEMSRIFNGCFAYYFTLFAGERIEYQIDDGPLETVRYEDLVISSDESRFAELDDIIKNNASGNFDELKELAKKYYVKDKLIDRIFDSNK